MSADRIAAVLRIRRLQERRERSEVAARRMQHRSAEHAERSAWTAVAARGFAPGEDAMLAGRIVARREALDGGIAVAQRRGEATRIASHALDVQVGSWTIAARRVEGLERLDDRLRTAERAELERRAAIEVEDLVLARRGRSPAGDAA